MEQIVSLLRSLKLSTMYFYLRILEADHKKRQDIPTWNFRIAPYPLVTIPNVFFMFTT